MSKIQKTPTILQMDATECGVAALSSILAYYGNWQNMKTMRTICKVTRNGTKLSHLINAAKYFGLTAEACMTSESVIFKSERPVIILWQADHYMVVEGCHGDHVYVNDPAMGPRKMTRQEFSAGFSNVALFLTLTDKFKKSGKKPSARSIVGPYIRLAKSSFKLLLLLSVLLIFPIIMLPFTTKILIDDIFIQNYTNWLIPLIAFLLTVAIFDIVSTFLQQYYSLMAENKIAVSLATKLFWHVLRLPISFLSQRYLGDIISRIYSCHAVGKIIATTLATTLVNFVMIIVCLIVMAILSWQLALVVVVFSLVSVLIMWHQSRSLKYLNLRYKNQSARTNGLTMIGLNMMGTLKTSSTENRFYETWTNYHTEVISLDQRLSQRNTLLDNSPSLLEAWSTAITLGVGGLLVMSGQLSIGGLVAFTGIAKLFNRPLRNTVNFTDMFQSLVANIQRIEDVMTQQVASTQEDYKIATNSVTLLDCLELKNVSFAYNEDSGKVLQEINLTIRSGEKVAIVGNCGSGKSTLFKLLAGLLVQTSGDIVSDGKPRADVVGGSIAWVDQDIKMFNDTIESNIAFFNSNIGQNEITAAAKIACVDDVIMARELGYQTEIHSSLDSFSNSEFQRFEIARAVLTNPKIILLDGVLDCCGTLLGSNIFHNMLANKPAIVVNTLNESILKECDQIYWLEEGKIVFQGTHSQLQQKSAEYAKLVLNNDK